MIELLFLMVIVSVGIIHYQRVKRRLWLWEREEDRKEREAVRNWQRDEAERLLREYKQ